MIVNRDYYLNKLIRKRHNGLIKIIVGMRRSGKSFLLFNLYYNYLLNNGVEEKQIIKLTLDDLQHAKYRNPFELDRFIRSNTKESRQYYILIDEIQFVEEIDNPWLENSKEKIGFTDVLLGLMKQENLDIYITGSNSKMLSKDIVTQFRDRGDRIHLYPLSYSEYCRAMEQESEVTWNDYLTYGGLPRLLNISDEEEKAKYLTDVFYNTYLKNVLERNDIKNDKKVIDEIIRIVASSVGSLTNPNNIANTFRSKLNSSIHSNTVDLYLDYFRDAFLLSKAYRYDIKGRKYIGSPLKYYFSDIGIRNALLNFRQQEENHIMENIIYNELMLRGYSVDVGQVNHRYINDEGKDIKTRLEVDFVARKANKKMYLQSALKIFTEEKRKQEINSLLKIDDNFKKIVVTRDNIKPWIDKYGINYVGVRELISGKHDDFEMV